MYKEYKKLVYTPPDLLARICKVNLSNAKKFGLICFPRICFRGLIYCDQEPLWLLNVIEDLCYFWVPASIFCANVQSLRNKSPNFLCYVCTMKKDIFLHWLTPVFLSMIFSSDQDWPPWVLNDGQFSRGPYCWWTAQLINYSLHAEQ